MHELYANERNLSFKNIDGGAWKQGWPVQYDASQWNATHPLEVFVLPHSHVDAGWLKTFDEYYQQQTRSIISSVVGSLAQDERRHFVWADIGFFQRWWDEASAQQRANVRLIVQRGQLEFVTGAWVTTDEANARYPEMLEQVLEGHEWLRLNLGVRPRFGWSIDPFGHSPTMAYLLQRVGFDAIAINRVHYSVKKLLAENQALEFYWEQRWQGDVAGAPADSDFFTPRFHPSAQILTHMFPFYSYDVPHTCGPEPAICCEFDFARGSCPWHGHMPTPITAQNVRVQAEKLLDQYRKKSTLFRSGAVLIPVGDDFRYVSPDECSLMFNNYQMVFDYINTHADEYHAHVRFANLSSYFDTVKSRLKTRSAVPVVRGDFFTYADRDNDYWSGYFTSRPFYKRLGRRTQATIRAAEVLHSLTHVQLPSAGASEPKSMRGSLLDARRTIGIFQHHDAVTGTAKTHVNDDYGRMLHHARHEMRSVIRDSLHSAIRASSAESPLTDVSSLPPRDHVLAHDEDSARDANMLPLQIPLSLDDGSRAVVFYNPLPYARREAVSVPVAAADARVLDSDGVPVVAQQLQPNWGDHGSQVSGLYRLHFVAALPPLGYATYFVERDEAGAATRRATLSMLDNSAYNRFEDASIAQSYRDAGFNVEHVSKLPESWALGTAATVDANGMLRSLVLNTDGSDEPRHLAISEGFGAYVTQSRQSSGAYLIDPAISRYEALHGRPHVRIVRGPVLDEAIVTLADGALPFQRVARVYHHDPTFVDVTHRFGMTAAVVDREVVARFDASAAVPTVVNRTFYSDSNGFQMHRRDFVNRIPKSANIYPCAAEAYVVDEPTATRFTVLAPQAHAVFSWNDGVLEFILDRRTSSDDARGVTQPLNDNVETESHMRLVLERTKTHDTPLDRSTSRAARLGRALEQHVHAFYATPNAPRTALSFKVSRFTPSRSFLESSWPDDVVLETLRVHEEDGSKLVVYVRRLAASRARTAITLTAPIFAGLDIVDSERRALSMMHRDDTYKHGDQILLKSMEIECYLLTVKQAEPRRVPPKATPRAVDVGGANRKQVDEPQQEQDEDDYKKYNKDSGRKDDEDDDDDAAVREPVAPCPPTKASESSSVLFVAGAMLCLQGMVALFSLGPSRTRNALAIVLFIATVMWLQMLVFGSFKHN